MLTETTPSINNPALEPVGVEETVSAVGYQLGVSVQLALS